MKKLFLLFLTLIFCSQIAFGIGITSQSTGEFPLTFQPGYRLTIPMEVWGYADHSSDVSLSIQGDLGEEHELLQYFSITDIEQIADDRTSFNVVLELPDDFAEPGTYYTALLAAPAIDPNAEGIFGVTAVRRMFVIKVLLQQIAISGTFSASNTNVDGTVVFRLPVRSETYQNMSNVWANISIYDSNGDWIDSIVTQTVSLPSDKQHDFIVNYDTKDLPPAAYTAIADVRYDGLAEKRNTSFSIGTLTVNLRNSTQELYQDEIGGYDIVVESGWNDVIEGVYADVTLEGVPLVKTATDSLHPWQNVTLQAFVDTRGLGLGERQINISVYYAGYEQHEERSITIIESPRILAEKRERMQLILLIVIPIVAVILGLIIFIIVLLKKQTATPAKKTARKKKK